MVGFHPPPNSRAAGASFSRKRTALVVLLFLGCFCSSGQAASAAHKISSSATEGPFSSFQLEPGFKVQLVASEPLIQAPVAMAFDENGRLFVAERPMHPTAPGDSPPGRVILLEDFDKQGAANSSRVYAENLPYASAIACYAGGIFVAAGRDVIYLKDRGGRDGAGVRQVVLTGFGGTNAPSLIRGLLNSFAWGPDDRIYGATAGLGGLISAPNWPGGPVSLDGCDFSFDPRTLAVFRETGPSQSGQTFDALGRRFLSDLNRPLRLAMYRLPYLARNPFFPSAKPMIDVASPATRVFARAALDSVPEGEPLAGRRVGASQPVWLTNPSGCVIYRGTLFPGNYRGNAFIPAAEQHLIHRAVLHDNGFGIVAERPAEERAFEFLSSSEPSFRPVQVITGPEGALYIADNQDGQERGRIYRVVPANFKPEPAPHLGQANTYELVSALASSDGWHSDTAARLLYEQRNPAAVPLLREMAADSSSPLARQRALRALNSAGGLRQPQVLKALADTNPVVRAEAVRLAENVLTNGVPSDALWAKLRTLVTDPDLRVRYQLAFTLGNLRHQERPVLLAALLRRDLANPWMQTAVLSSSAYRGGELFVQLAANPTFLSEPAGHEFLVELAAMLGVEGQLGDVVQALEYVRRAHLAPLQSFAFLAAVGDGLYRTASALPLVDARGLLLPFYVQARDATIAGNLLAPATRVAAMQLLGFSTYSYSDLADWLLILCNPGTIPSVQAAAISTLCRYNDPRAVSALLDKWASLNPLSRTQALDAWLSRDIHVPAVIQAIAARRISTNDLSSIQEDVLRTYPDAAVRERALALFGPAREHRPEALKEFKSAAQFIGSPDAGRAIFLERCSACHRMGRLGEEFGPDLTGARGLGKDALLEKIIEPNVNVRSNYRTSLLRSKQGDNVLGIEREPNPTTIILRQPGGNQVVWPRLNTDTVQTESWSLMPEGLEQGLTVQSMADLLEYLMNAPR
jgi:putative membrane-bound dehydrogenase-like protein